MPDNKLYRILRIFISSPSDVAPERARLATVIREDLQWLANELGFMLEMLDWPNVAPGAGRPEQVILDKYHPQTWDVFVGIMWHRFGTPPQKFNAGAAETYFGGTEEEFRAAYSLWERHRQPRVMFYRCDRPAPLNALEPDQLKRVRKFFKGFSPEGRHPGFYHTYMEPGDFERAVRRHLGQLVFEYWRESVADGLTGRKPVGAVRKAAKKPVTKSVKKAARKSAAPLRAGAKNRKR
ncbi:MAG: DUF4062 domain-containing protein [Acidobacteriota bacterium]|nr:DUF4062 domain-containing protein [Acidobacteriota bacterium]